MDVADLLAVHGSSRRQERVGDEENERRHDPVPATQRPADVTDQYHAKHRAADQRRTPPEKNREQREAGRNEQSLTELLRIKLQIDFEEEIGNKWQSKVIEASPGNRLEHHRQPGQQQRDEKRLRSADLIRAEQQWNVSAEEGNKEEGDGPFETLAAIGSRVVCLAVAHTNQGGHRIGKRQQQDRN